MTIELSETRQVRMSPREAKALAWLAKRDGRTASSLIRRLITDEYARVHDVLKQTTRKGQDHGSEEDK